MNLDEKYVNILAMLRQSAVKPSYREMGEVLGISLCPVSYRMHRLREHGYIDFEDGKARSARVTEKGLAVLPELILVRENNGILEIVQ